MWRAATREECNVDLLLWRELYVLSKGRQTQIMCRRNHLDVRGPSMRVPIQLSKQASIQRPLLV